MVEKRERDNLSARKILREHKHFKDTMSSINTCYKEIGALTAVKPLPDVASYFIDCHEPNSVLSQN